MAVSPLTATRVLLLVVATSVVVWAASARYAIGLDFEGGLVVWLDVGDDEPEAGLRSARELLAIHDLRGIARLQGDDVVLEINSADETPLGRLGKSLSGMQFGIFGSCDGAWTHDHNVSTGVERVHVGHSTAFQVKTDADATALLGQLRGHAKGGVFRLERQAESAQHDQEASIRVHCLESTPILASADIVGAKVVFSEFSHRPQVEIDLAPNAQERFHQYTAANVQTVLAIVINDDIVSAPVINEAIPGGTIALSPGADETLEEAQAQARQLRAARFNLTIRRSEFIAPGISPTLGRPTLIAVGVLAVVGWLALLLFQRAHWAFVVAATFFTALALAEVTALGQGATLTTSTHYGAVLLALAAAVGVVLVGPGPPQFRHKLTRTWLGLVPFAAALAIAVWLSGTPGPRRGIGITIVLGIVPVALVSLAAMLALPSARVTTTDERS